MRERFFSVRGVARSIVMREENLAALDHGLHLARTRPTRYSLLKLFQDSPRAYLLGVLKQDPGESLASKLGAYGSTEGRRKKPDAMRIGTAVHQLALGAAERVVIFDGIRRGERWERFSDEHAANGNTIVSTREWLECQAMVDRLMTGPKVFDLLFDGTKQEEVIDWTVRGKAIRSTPDARTVDRIVDLKTCQRSGPPFIRQIYSSLYHVQLECYAQAMEAQNGVRPSEAYIVAVDREHPARAYRISDEALAIGARVFGSWIEQLVVCEASGNFPYLEVCEAPLPDYLREAEELAELPEDLIEEIP